MQQYVTTDYALARAVAKAVVAQSDRTVHTVTDPETDLDDSGVDAAIPENAEAVEIIENANGDMWIRVIGNGEGYATVKV